MKSFRILLSWIISASLCVHLVPQPLAAVIDGSTYSYTNESLGDLTLPSRGDYVINITGSCTGQNIFVNNADSLTITGSGSLTLSGYIGTKTPDKLGYSVCKIDITGNVTVNAANIGVSEGAEGSTSKSGVNGGWINAITISQNAKVTTDMLGFSRGGGGSSGGYGGTIKNITVKDNAVLTARTIAGTLGGQPYASGGRGGNGGNIDEINILDNASVTASFFGLTKGADAMTTIGPCNGGNGGNVGPITLSKTSTLYNVTTLGDSQAGIRYNASLGGGGQNGSPGSKFNWGADTGRLIRLSTTGGFPAGCVLEYIAPSTSFTKKVPTSATNILQALPSEEEYLIKYTNGSQKGYLREKATGSTVFKGQAAAGFAIPTAKDVDFLPCICTIEMADCDDILVETEKIKEVPLTATAVYQRNGCVTHTTVPDVTITYSVLESDSVLSSISGAVLTVTPLSLETKIVTVLATATAGVLSKSETILVSVENKATGDEGGNGGSGFLPQLPIVVYDDAQIATSIYGTQGIYHNNTFQNYSAVVHMPEAITAGKTTGIAFKLDVSAKGKDKFLAGTARLNNKEYPIHWDSFTGATIVQGEKATGYIYIDRSEFVSNLKGSKMKITVGQYLDSAAKTKVQEGSKTIPISVDYSPPIISAEFNKYAGLVTIETFDSVSGVKEVRYAIDGGTYKAYTVPFPVTTANKKISVLASDHLENISSQTLTLQLTTAPADKADVNIYTFKTRNTIGYLINSSKSNTEELSFMDLKIS